MPQARRRRWIVAASAAALLLATALRAGAAEVLFVYPPPNSLITESPVPVLGYVLGDPVDALTARVVSEERRTEPGRFDLYLFKGKVFSGSLDLNPGRNNVVVGDTVIPLLYRPGFEGDAEDGFRRPRPHAGGIESCNPCHGFSRGSLTLKGRVPDLCLQCHKVGTESLRAVIKKNRHTREITPDCLRCHDPHVSFEAALLRKGRGGCSACHADQARPSLHGNVGDSACGACHDPHASAYPSMLRGDALTLCRRCHDDVADPDRYPRSYHRPVDDGNCFVCHRPHAGTYPSLLKDVAPALCAGCHDEAKADVHGGELEECRLCHEPHLSDRPALLKPGVSEACVDCHGDPAKGKNRHPALKNGCVTCHNPHDPKGLKAADRVCGQCHNLRKEGFRAAHGRLPMDDVRQCTFCHDPHASDYPGLLRGNLHYPLQNGGCSACHEVRKGKLELRYEGSKNCTRCHGQITGTSEIIETDKVHKPVYQIDCIACHNPHLGVRDKFLLEEPVTLCGWCHGILLRGVKNVHGVFDKGNCYTCHLPHISDFRPLLKRPEKILCTSCHTGILPEKVSEQRMLHGALRKGRCTGCHNPHGTNTEKLLKGSRDELCARCHPGVLQGEGGKPLRYVHGPVGAGNCTACHELEHRHERQGDRFLRARGSRVCALCHDTAPDHVPPRFRAKMSEVRNDCLACHLPHGSDNRFMMREGYY